MAQRLLPEPLSHRMLRHTAHEPQFLDSRFRGVSGERMGSEAGLVPTPCSAGDSRQGLNFNACSQVWGDPLKGPPG